MGLLGLGKSWKPKWIISMIGITWFSWIFHDFGKLSMFFFLIILGLLGLLCLLWWSVMMNQIIGYHYWNTDYDYRWWWWWWYSDDYHWIFWIYINHKSSNFFYDSMNDSWKENHLSVFDWVIDWFWTRTSWNHWIIEESSFFLGPNFVDVRRVNYQNYKELENSPPTKAGPTNP